MRALGCRFHGGSLLLEASEVEAFERFKNKAKKHHILQQSQFVELPMALSLLAPPGTRSERIKSHNSRQQR